MSTDAISSALAHAAHQIPYRTLATAVAGVFIGVDSAQVLAASVDSARIRCMSARQASAAKGEAKPSPDKARALQPQTAAGNHLEE
jgi:hypothetical protein